MKPALLAYLRCPGCRSKFALETYEQIPVMLSDQEKQILFNKARNLTEYGSEILSGILTCRGCGDSFPVWRGVPRIYKDAEKEFPVNRNGVVSTEKLAIIPHEKNVQTSFSREWEVFSYDDQTIWLWTTDERMDTFCEEIGISSPEKIQGKLMIDAGCGSGILSMNLSSKYLVEVIAFDLSNAVGKAFRVNKSNLCHFIQASVFKPPLAESFADITYSHGVLHHTYSTKTAFEAIASLTKPGGLLYVWLYGRKKGWNRFRFIFIRAARTVISRLPRIPQTVMVYFMAFIHIVILSLKKLTGMKRAKYKTKSQFLVGIRDKYTPHYAREHTEEEVKNWFMQNGYTNVTRRTNWEKTKAWSNSTDLSIKAIRECAE